MQNSASLPSSISTARRPLVISWEAIAYSAIALLALTLYVAVLGSTALSNAEAGAALSAWRFIDPAAPGMQTPTASPLVFLVQSLSFTALGGSEGAARIGTALAAAALVLLPALLRDALGKWRALLLSLLLACSPIVIITARSSAPAIWSALLAGLTVWAGYRYMLTRINGWGYGALIALVLLIFATEPGGLVLALTILAAAIVAWLSAPMSVDEDDPFDITHWRSLRMMVAAFPWGRAVPAAALVTIALATVFMLYPTGLTSVGNVIGGALAGWITRTPDTPFLFPLFVSLFYEPWLWVLAIGTLVWLLRRQRMDFADRFSLLWLGFALVPSALYGGAQAQHALWLTLPLVAIISRLGSALLEDADVDAPIWARWVVALCVVALLAMGSMAFQGFARTIPNLSAGLQALTQANYLNIVILVIVLAFFIVGYFLVRSLWEQDSVPLRGLALGIATFALIAGIGSGWRTSVEDAGNPVDLWQREAASSDALLLRETLFDVAERTNKGYAEMPLVVLSAGNAQIEWAVRDFRNARFASRYEDVIPSDVVVLAYTVGEVGAEPPLPGAYVGQDFVMARAWSLLNLLPQDYVQWWTQRRVSTPTFLDARAVLWVRADVYADGSVE
ncbi:MAG: glycosyltransferase family 39 protein [Chloroflexota bacterium]|nr:glycosyltransferase family 39 protein [Chloroflexota bacterium]